MTFRIRNQGTNALDLSAVLISAGEFSIITPPSDMSLALGEATSFTIRFAASTLGTHTATVTILSNDTDEGVFTFDVTGRATVRSISGSIAEDWDGDGQRDPEDVLLSGRVVFVDENGNGQLDGGERSATTDASGFYFFDEVPVGSYQVRTVAVAGWTLTGTHQHPITIYAPGDVFRDVDFTSVKNDRFYAIVFNDADLDGTFDPDELPFVDRQLLVDSNGNGTLDSAFNTYLYATPTLIPNNSTVTSTVLVENSEFPITDVDVRVNISMLWNSQLQVYLEHPDGTLVELFTNVGGASDNFFDTILDDQAPTSITSGTAPFTGRFRPEGLLSALNGKSGNGTWGLRISDPSGFEEATLNQWELLLTTGEAVKTTGAFGTTHFDLQAGTYDVHLQTLTGWDHTQPVGGVRTVTPDGTPLVAQYYGSRKLPPAISGYVVEDWNGNGLREAQDRPLLGRTVFIDQNNNGVFEDALESNTFLQSTPSNIPNSATILSPLEVSGFIGVLTDVNVSLDITHSWVSDLDVALIAPDGTRVVLFEDIGGANDNFRDTVLDDEATTPISNGSAPYTGSFRPFGQLSDFDSIDPNGTWYLEVTDDFGLNDGTLNRWGLAITAGEQSTSTDADGFYQFDVLPNGSYNIRSVATDDWIVTGDNHYNVTITSPLDSFAELTFGSGKNNRLYTTVFNDTNVDGILGTSEEPLAERTVFIDTNGNGTVDELLNSIVDTNTYVVPDRSRISAPLAVAIIDSPILDVDVRVNITSSFNFEVETHLIHPDGTRVELFTNVGSSSQNFTNTILDDQAAAPITSGSAPFTGRYRPEGLLSVLNGKSPNGTWQLEVRDIFTGNFLRLNEWELMIRTTEVDLTTDDVGTAYQDLLPGTYEVALLSVENWNHTLPIDGRRTVPADGTPLFNQTFGSIEVELVPPTIVASIAAGTAWSSSFIAGVDGEGTGNGLGMPLLAGMSSLPFSNINRLYIQFSEPVTEVIAANIELRNSQGTLPFNLLFDQNSSLATLELPSPLPAGKYRLSASDAIADLSGNPLDGDASGDAGGIFTIRFDVMPSDTTGDRRVGTDDLLPFGPAFNSQIGQTAYNWRIDWNADGRIATNDLLIFAAHFNQRIDNLSEPGAPFGGGGRGSGLFYMAAPPRDTDPWDSFYNQLGSRDDEREELELLGLKN